MVAAADDPQALMRLLTWMSPAFPIGAFSYSSGLESAVAQALVTDSPSLRDWIEAQVEHGSIWNDAVLLVAASQCGEDQAALAELAQLGLALAGSSERYRETLLLGQAFREAARAWPVRALDLLPQEVNYPVAVGAIGAGNSLRTTSVVIGFLHSCASQLVSAGIRLGATGQSQGLVILAALEPVIEGAARRACASTLDDLGTATIAADIGSLRHEVMHSRLFRS